MQRQKSDKTTSKPICENRKARFEYEITDTYEAGLVLTGSEVKSLRQGKAQLANAYADIRGGEVLLLQAHIAPYEKGGYANHEPMRQRKLLLAKKEIHQLIGKIQTKGFSLIPLKMYFKGQYAKILLGLGKGKKAHDKRDTIKDRDSKRELDKSVKANLRKA